DPAGRMHIHDVGKIDDFHFALLTGGWMRHSITTGHATPDARRAIAARYNSIAGMSRALPDFAPIVRASFRQSTRQAPRGTATRPMRVFLRHRQGRERA